MDKRVNGLLSLIESQKSEKLKSFEDKFGAITSWEDGYSIQQNVCEILENEYSDKYQKFGYKIGGTSDAVASIWGISEPFVSPFYNTWHYLNNETAEKSKGLTLGVESEFIFKIGTNLNIDDINKDKLTLDDIYPLVDAIYPGFELIEPRIVHDDSDLNNGIFNLPIQVLIADLCWTGGVVIGQESKLSDLGYSTWKEYDEKELRDAAVEIYVNNDQFGIGYGRNVLQSPFNALLYVYNHLLKQGKTLKEGELVSTGTCTGCTFLKKEDTAEAVFENIGDVELKLT